MSATPHAWRPLHIFVAENHPDTLESLIVFLECEGHTVSWATGVEEALKAIPGAGCDVLIADIGLGDGTGWELLARLGAERPLYAVAMSGFGMNADLQKSLTAGFQRHLLKPVTPEMLDEVIAEACGAEPSEEDPE